VNREQRIAEAVRQARLQIAAGRARVERWRIDRKILEAETPYRRLVPEAVRRHHAYLRAQILHGPSYKTWPGLAYALRELGVRSRDGTSLGGF
jgi:hypothetical protein